MAYNAKVLCDSLSPDGVRLITMEVTFARCVLAEINTHRAFSRNSASSRAIPIAKMLQRVQDDPFIPIYWGRNQSGMQANEELTPEAQALALEQWLLARDNAVKTVERLQSPDINLHKQIANRLLEPFLYHTAIISATEWGNFWGLRCHPAAQPEIRKAADLMRAEYDASEPFPVNYGDWHLPLVRHAEAFDLQVNGMSLDDVVKVSAGRCARVSYLTHAGIRDPKADIELCDRLVSSGHMSPLEHVARPMTREDAERLVCASVDLPARHYIDIKQVFCGNYRGWVQARKELQHEADFSARPSV